MAGQVLRRCADRHTFCDLPSSRAVFSRCAEFWPAEICGEPSVIPVQRLMTISVCLCVTADTLNADA